MISLFGKKYPLIGGPLKSGRSYMRLRKTRDGAAVLFLPGQGIFRYRKVTDTLEWESDPLVTEVADLRAQVVEMTTDTSFRSATSAMDLSFTEREAPRA